MARFWSILHLLISPENLKKNRDLWGRAGWDMATALTYYDEAWLRIADSSKYMEVLQCVQSAEQPESQQPESAEQPES